MHLIEPLVTGVNGAGNGHAELYARGTSTRSTWYADFEGVTSDATGDNIALDSNGGVEAYVDDTVDVIVKDSDGTTIREFTAGSKDAGIEVISTSFQGTNYASGAAGVSLPVDLQTVLDKWIVSAGADDFDVLVGGVATRLQDALSASVALYYNVKDTTYGAVGDGSTDDKVAIQAAIDAAETAGGGVVFFPQGVYRISGLLTQKANVNLLGVGGTALGSVIEINSSTANLFEVENTAFDPGTHFVQDIYFRAAQACSGNLWDIVNTSGGRLEFNRCQFEVLGGNNTGTLVNLGATSVGFEVMFRNCSFYPTTTDQRAFCDNSTVNGVTQNAASFVDCVFLVPATYASTARGVVDVRKLFMTGCEFIAEVHTTSNFNWIYLDAAAAGWKARVVGNYFSDNAGAGTVTAFYFDNAASLAATHLFYESDNVFLCDSPYEANAVMDGGSAFKIDLGSRRGATLAYETDAGADIELLISDAQTHFVDVSDTTAFEVKVSLGDGRRIQTEGMVFTVILENNAGGTSGNITFGSTAFKGDATSGTITIQSNRFSCYTFVCKNDVAASNKFIQLGAGTKDFA